MTAPMDPVEPAHSYPSPLWEASIRLQEHAPPLKPPAPSAGDPSQSIRMSTREILNLFQRFRLHNIKFEDLSKIPWSMLNPAERQFIWFLLRNEHYFRMIASLDRVPDTLSPEDVKIAAQLAGDTLVLSEEDLKYLKERPATRIQGPSDETAASPRSAPTESVPAERYDEPRLIDLLRKIAPEPITAEQLSRFQPKPGQLTPEEEDMLHFLQSRPVQRVFAHITPSLGGLLTPDIIRIMSSLIWNPAVYSALPIMFFKPPTQVKEEMLPVQPVEEVSPEAENASEEPDGQFRMKLHAPAIFALFKKLSPDGHVTLAQLRDYAPQNPEEARIVNMLKQTKVFNVLANLDHDRHSISQEDIKLAMTEGALFISDPHLLLVILE